MSRRQACGLLLVALLLAGGRFVRHALLVDGAGAWRDPLLLDSLLPPMPATSRAGASGGEADSAAAPFNGVLEVNRCPADSLELLPGVGPTLAARIVAERRARGPFRAPDDLQRVKGIGPRLSARLAPRMRFATSPPAADSSLTERKGAASR